ncbi:hypothetical protein TRSC58_04715 [Trypanosoma rangeli SC58]|uniref:Uncharacterized protein n=1 Tax=Trypanosoma rangeli SC58 TaxID=429131 RepID=A0A061IWV0_TRYRA|nr:hypothetical protein TRSC58_04715 [Trypanosoma rangeli SC58]
MLRRVRWAFKGSRGRSVLAYSTQLSCLLLLLWMLWCLLATAPVNGDGKVTPPRPPGSVFALSHEGSLTGPQLWKRPRSSASNDGSFVGRGPESAAACQSSVCRFCDELQLNNAPGVLHPSVLEYLRRHVLIGVVTGSYEKFFRVDLGLCTWLQHVPAANLFVFTDAANTSDGRHGTWVETDTVPVSQRMRKGMLRRTGYSVGWMRAQYRFFHAFSYFAGLTGVGSEVGKSTAAYREVRWVIVVDDDSFLDLHALSRFLHRRDLNEVARIAAGVEVSPLWERCNRRPGARLEDVAACLSLPERWRGLQQQLHGGDLLQPRSPALVVGSALWNATMHTLLNPATAAALAPLYVGDRGWGGAGHFMNLAALRNYSQKGEETCVWRYLIGRQLASDTALHRCIPLLGIHRGSDAVLSHCQARYLRERLLHGELVSMHAKRDMVQPKYLAMWRMQLYYQVLYHRNRTAYDLLMRVGACAYGYTCKLSSCRAAEDAAALSEFARLSNNATRMPAL